MKQNQHQPIRVLQIIDSLEAGGGERMAVNLANALHQKVDFSGLIATRKEGLLKAEINHLDHYLYVNKRRSVDFKALSLAIQFIKQHQITHLHAHSTSFFFATLIKIRMPKLKLIWHDHYGESEQLIHRPRNILKYASFFFKAIISVNEKLKKWAEDELNCSQVSYIKNFSRLSFNNIPKQQQFLKKGNEIFHLIQVANIRPQKNHEVAIEALKLLSKTFSVKLHLLGQYHINDRYYQSIKDLIHQHQLDLNVEFYGSVENVQAYLEEADIALLSSRSEGLPVSLLEYAIAQKPVVITDVGQCASVVGDFAKVVQPGDPNALAAALKSYLAHPQEAKKDAELLHKKVISEYGEAAIINQIVEIYKAV
ncbi:glycosyltransferase [Psychroflexus sp. ALD_RP9]|uniref:glycosyltransferase n=1 Tax=Psychroflexus sp. ALD_RP9 TaxID=2777186 RepID=UPI001A90BE93|nr:glycosyltransferase [Psychroflexus sp. ALD_RP9]QSS96412.1 glycosyltransferase [Psychroflexus sp. ALD_RP9]